MCIKKLIFAGIVLIFSMHSSQASDQFSNDESFDDSVVINDESSIEEVVIPVVNRLTTSNPDEIYQSSLSSSDKLTDDVYVLDFHGMLVNEDNPQQLKPGQQLTPRGDAISNVRTLIENGAIVIFCSAWDNIDETVAQMLEVGFTKKDLGVVDEQATPESSFKKITLPKGNSIYIQYMKYGRVISTKLFFDYNDRYYRQKAFSPFLYEDFEIDAVERIYFLDDSEYNCKEFENNVQRYNIYPGKEVNVYNVIDPSPFPF